MLHPPDKVIEVEIRSTIDIVMARQRGREMAMALGFSGSEVTLIAAAISEIARNILDHAKHGKITVRAARHDKQNGIEIIAEDQGPGIPDLTLAMQYGYSSRRGLGVGLPGAKWLMDTFEIDSEVGRGTTIVMRKWLRDGPVKFTDAD